MLASLDGCRHREVELKVNPTPIRETTVIVDHGTIKLYRMVAETIAAKAKNVKAIPHLLSLAVTKNANVQIPTIRILGIRFIIYSYWA